MNTPIMQARRWTAAAVLLFLGASLTPRLGAQERPDSRPALGVAVRGGLFMPRAGGDLFNLMRRELTLAASDLRGGAMGVEVSARVFQRIQLLAGWETTSSETLSRTRDPLAPDGRTQTTTFDLGSSVFAGARIFLFQGRGREGPAPTVYGPANGYLAIGGGWKSFELEQKGDFPGEYPGSTFDARFSSQGSTAFPFVAVGAEIAIPAGLSLRVEGRYQGGEAVPDGDFAAFDSIDLGGIDLSLVFVRYW